VTLTEMVIEHMEREVGTNAGARIGRDVACVVYAWLLTPEGRQVCERMLHMEPSAISHVWPPTDATP